jgi:pimeloyl-ACP methyl ester carboxylesterase
MDRSDKLVRSLYPPFPLPAVSQPFHLLTHDNCHPLTPLISRYKAVLRNIDAAVEAAIPPANIIVSKPVIFVGGDRDLVTRAELTAAVAEQGKSEGWLPDVEVKSVAGGSHWLMLEQPKQVFDILDAFAKSA